MILFDLHIRNLPNVVIASGVSARNCVSLKPYLLAFILFIFFFNIIFKSNLLGSYSKFHSKRDIGHSVFK